MKIITLSIPVTPAQAKAIVAAGPGCSVHHARAGARGGRLQLSRSIGAAIGKLGLSIDVGRLIKTLAWSTTGEPAKAQPVAPKSKRRNARKAGPVDET